MFITTFNIPETALKNELDLITALEQRKAARKILLGRAVFASPELTVSTALTIDLSTGGLSLILPKALVEQPNCAISFDVPLQYQPQRVLVSGRVISCQRKAPQSYRVGVQFVHADWDSFEMIRMAIDHNLHAAIV